MISRLLGLAAAQAALFPAQKLAPPTSIEREAQRRALDLIRETYGAYATNSTISRHFFVRLAPAALQHELSKFVWNDNALRAVRAQFPAGAFVVAPLRRRSNRSDRVGSASTSALYALS